MSEINIIRNNKFVRNGGNLGDMEKYMDYAQEYLNIIKEGSKKEDRNPDSVKMRSVKYMLNNLALVKGMSFSMIRYYKGLFDDSKTKIIRNEYVGISEIKDLTLADVQEQILKDCKNKVTLKNMIERTPCAEEDFVIDVINEYASVCGYVDKGKTYTMKEFFGEDIIADFVKDSRIVRKVDNRGYIDDVEPNYNKLSVQALDYLEKSGVDTVSLIKGKEEMGA